MPEPQKFHIGLIDLFSVWLPGALLVYLLQGDVRLCLLPSLAPLPGSSVETWAIFLFASYLAGHFIFVAGAIVFDRIDGIIRKGGWRRWERIAGSPREQSPPQGSPPGGGEDVLPCDASEREWQTEEWKKAGPIRRMGGQIWKKAKPNWKKRAEGLWKRLDSALGLASLFLFDEEDWTALEAVRDRKRHHLAAIDADPAINAFQWSKARLAIESPEALAIVERLEADSKFFRSLCAVLSILAGWGAVTCHGLMFWTSALLLPAAFSRFVGLRGKSVSQAYWLLLVIETTPAKAKGGA
jgi:hypothetical protein